MLQPRRTLFPLLAGTLSVIIGVTVLVIGVMLLFALFGFALHVLWFTLRLAIIVGLITLGLRLIMRRS
jgi:hypothetical protein